MRIFLTISFLLIYISSIAQNDSAQKDSAIIFIGTMEFPQVSKKQLFDNTIILLSDAMKDVSKSIELKDLDNGLITGNANIKYVHESIYANVFDGKIMFEYKFQFKEGKLKYAFSNFEHKNEVHNRQSIGKITSEEFYSGTCSGCVKKNRIIVYEEIKNTIQKTINSFIENLKEVDKLNSENW